MRPQRDELSSGKRSPEATRLTIERVSGTISRMSKPTAVVQTRVPVRRLQRAEKILHKLGLTPADAVNMLLAQIEIRQGLPFEVSTRPRPLLSAGEQAEQWTKALGAY
jgi:addiction module RelB/DinJ family antitoxin